MRYLAIATDFDGTLAHDARVDDSTIQALTRARDSGRRVILVTGRELDDLRRHFSRFDLFDHMVLENGAVLYHPGTQETKLLASAPPAAFLDELRRRGVGPISVGHVIVATWEPHQNAVLETIHDLGLELQVIFNKGAVMILPSGVNKATGLAAALGELGLSLHNTIGVGDAENDHAFLAACEASVAVANALPALKERVDLVTGADHGAGVVELINRLLTDDLADLAPRLNRHALLLGARADGREERVEAFGVNVLVAGPSGGGKSTITTGLLERLTAAGYQYVILDPEGDYAELEGAVVLGSPQRAPLIEEALAVLGASNRNAVVNLLGVSLEDRPAFADSLLPRLQELRTRTGRPHWIIVDEAHHLLPTTWAFTPQTLPRLPRGMLFITVHPESVAAAVLESVDLLLAVGKSPNDTVTNFCRGAKIAAPQVGEVRLESGEVLAWRPRVGAPPATVRTVPARAERVRHSRKYAEGNLGPTRSFRFRGPEGKLNLKAQNLFVFLQLADGVDDETWLYHLRLGDYATWFRDEVKDPELAAAAERAAIDFLTARQSRAVIRSAVEKRYTLPADKPSGHVKEE